MYRWLSDHTWDFRPFKKCFSQNIAFSKVAFCLNEMVYLLIGEQGFLGQVITLPFFHAGGSLLFINYIAINTASFHTL